MGALWFLTKSRRPSSSSLQTLDRTIHQLLKIRRVHRLLPLMARMLVRTLSASHATIFLEEPQTRHYRLSATYGTNKPTAVQQLDEDSLLIRYLIEYSRPLRASQCSQWQELHHKESSAKTPPSPQRRLGFILQNLHAEVVVPSFRDKRLVGLVVLGPKRNGRVYSADELAILGQLANSCALALENARRFEELDAAAHKLVSTQHLLLEQQRLADVGKLAMGLAHEIRNPLTGIKTFTEVLPERYDDPDFRERFVRLVPPEVDRIVQIVQSLSDFAKPPLLKLKAVDLQTVLAETVGLLSNECLNRDVRVTKQYDAEHIYLNADPAALKQVFLNLCKNALDAMEHGGTLSVSSKLEETVEVIRISDTGSGIPPEHLAHIFDAFFTTKQGGMGLGLAVVKQIVNQHLGTITVDSNVGYGTTFEIRLPHAVRLKSAPDKEAHPRTALLPTEPPQRLAAPIHVLVVDDERKIQDLLKGRLESLGAQVSAVASGEEALAVMAQTPQELILLDLKLPQTDGFDVLRRVKQEYPTTAVVVVTGEYDEQVDAYVRSVGALACLHKPLDFVHLQELAYQVAARSSPPTST